MTAYSSDVTVQDFDARVIEASKTVPVLVDFWAEWCGPCRTLKPMLEKLAEEYGGRFLLAKVDSDRHQELAQRYGVRGIPNVKAFRDGEMVDEFTGAQPEPIVRDFIERLLPSPADPLREQARAAWQAGDHDSASRLLLKAIEADPRNEAARLDLAELLIDAGAADAARQILDSLADAVRDRNRLEALQARLALLTAGSQGDADEAELNQRIEADPADLDARLILANQLALRQDYRPAMAQLMEIVQRDRAFGDDIGRKTLLQLFSLVPDDELVREYRRKLAGALNR